MKTGEQSFVFSVDAEWVLKVKADKDDEEDSRACMNNRKDCRFFTQPDSHTSVRRKSL